MMTQLCNNPKTAASLLGPIDKLLTVELFKALCDPTRNKILCCLSKCARPCSVSEIAECCHVDLSVVSRHLSILANADVLDSFKEGRTVFYTVRYKEICTLLRNLAQAFEDCCPTSLRKNIKK